MQSLNFALLSAYILSVLLLLLTPGPVVMLITGTAVRAGYKQAFLTTLGTNLASMVLMSFAVLTISGVVSLNRSYLSLLGVAGSLFIGWGALQTLRELPRVNSPATHRGSAFAGGVRRGFFIGVANPKDIVFFVAFFPQFIAVSNDFVFSITLLCVLWIFFDFAVMIGYIVAITRFLPLTQGRCFCAGSALFLLLVALCGVAWNVRDATAILAG